MKLAPNPQNFAIENPERSARRLWELPASAKGGKRYDTLFRSLAHARVVLAAWRRDYNEQRPHSKLGWMTPSEYAAAVAQKAAE